MTELSQSGSYLGQARSAFHAALMETGVLTIDASGIPSNADGGQRSSVSFARGVAVRLLAETGKPRLPGQTAGGHFEAQCAAFLLATLPRLAHVRPATWEILQVRGRTNDGPIARFEQYEHLLDLANAVAANRELQAALGNAYLITPDVVVGRLPLTDEVINQGEMLVDGDVARRTPLRAVNQTKPILHAVISCKWTLRSDRAQNARSEALNLIRNRKGRLPHIVVVTGEPSPSRLVSLPLGTGDIDCVYHFALPELIQAIEAEDNDEAQSLLRTMVDGKRLRDIADLPLDLAV